MESPLLNVFGFYIKCFISYLRIKGYQSSKKFCLQRNFMTSSFIGPSMCEWCSTISTISNFTIFLIRKRTILHFGMRKPLEPSKLPPNKMQSTIPKESKLRKTTTLKFKTTEWKSCRDNLNQVLLSSREIGSVKAMLWIKFKKISVKKSKIYFK